MSTSRNILVQLQNPYQPNPGFSKKETILYAAVGFSGATAGMLYWGPTAEYAATFSDPAMQIFMRWATFIGGAVGYSGSNIFYSFYGIPSLLQILNRFDSRIAKFSAGLTTCVFAASQTAPVFFASEATNESVWNTALNVQGAFPGAIYGATNLIPKLLNLLTSAKIYILEDAETKYARRLYQIRLNALQQKLKAFKNEFMNMPREKFENRNMLLDLNRIANHPEIPENNDCGIKTIGSMIGLSLGGIFFSAPLLSVYYGLNMPTIEAGIALTALFDIALAYSHLSVTVDGVNTLMRIVKDLIQGRKIEELDTWKMYPKLTVAAATIFMLLSIPSYAVIYTIFNKYYNWYAKDEAAKTAAVGVSFYHFVALFFKLYPLLLNKLSSNPGQQYYHFLNNLLEQFKSLHPSKLFNFITEISNEATPDDVTHLVNQLTISTTAKVSPTKSWWSSVRALVCCKSNRGKEIEDIDVTLLESGDARPSLK